MAGGVGDEGAGAGEAGVGEGDAAVGWADDEGFYGVDVAGAEGHEAGLVDGEELAEGVDGGAVDGGAHS